MVRVRPVVFAFFLMTPTIAWAQTADQCRDVLANGVRDTIQSRTSNDLRFATKEWFCSSAFESYSSARSSSTSISVPLQNGTAEYGDQEADQSSRLAREEFCSDAAAQFSENDASIILRQIASPTVVEAWSDCMRNRLGGQPIQFQARRVDPQSFILVANWRPTVSGESAPVIDFVRVQGADCGDDRLKAGATLTIQPLRELCTQTGQDAATVILGTSYGDYEAKLERDLTGMPAGEVSLVYGRRVDRWSSGPLRTTQRTTANHHCSRNCRGEPTRTSYQLELTARDGERFVDPIELKCIGGPCGGWNQVMLVRHDGSTATGAWDVWTAPSTWELSVATEIRSRDLRNFRSRVVSVNYGETFSFDVGRTFENPRLRVVQSGRTRDLALSESDELEIVSRKTDGDRTTYEFKLRPAPE